MADLEKKQWRCVNLDTDKADDFRRFLRETGIKYEASGNGNLIHFEVLVGNKEKQKCDDFLSGREGTHD